MFGSPASWIPTLATAHVEIFLALLAVLATTPRMLRQRFFHRTPQVFTALLFFLLVVCSPVLAGWFGGIPMAIKEQAPVVLVLLLVRVNCDSLGGANCSPASSSSSLWCWPRWVPTALRETSGASGASLPRIWIPWQRGIAAPPVRRRMT